jgi:Na+-driven multidrug efflux pump
MPTAGGVLNIISGAFGIIGSIFLFFFGAFMSAFREYYYDPELYELPVAFWWIMGIFLIIVSVVALVGGIAAVQRRAWGLALAGSIAAILQGGNLLGIIAVIFIALSKNEFRS